MTEISWDFYRSFLAVLRTGSLSGAARALDLTQPTVGRHIEAMETSLKLPLFVRSQAGFSPTPEATRLRAYAEALESTVAALRREASSHGESGTVRISASEIVGAEILPPLLERLQIKHPGIKIELSLSNEVVNLLSREADIAVRMTDPKQEALISRKIGETEVGLHAHRRYLERAGTPMLAGELDGHALIGFDNETEFIRSFKKRLAGFSREKFALSTDSDLAILAGIRAGVGIGFCQTLIANRDKKLVRILATDYQVKLGIWLVMHENLRTNAACKRVYAMLAEGLREALQS